MAQRVLVTYGWCRTAYAAVKSLARRGYRVFSCSGHAPAMCAWSRFSAGSARVADPFSCPEDFVGDVARLAEQWRIDVVLPGHEDALPLRRQQHRLPPSLVLACPELDALELGVDKGRVTRAAIAAGVPVPDTRFPTSVDEAVAAGEELGFPVVVKLRRSNSGKGVALATSPESLRATLEGRFARFLGSAGAYPIVQRFVDGPVVGGCFLARQGEAAAVFLERYLRCKDGRFGTSVLREPLDRAPLAEQVRALVRHLGWTGLGHFDFIEDPRGGDVLLEMNPRLWGALELACVNGYDFPAALVGLTLGEEDLTTYFAPSRGRQKRSLWIVGELIATVNELRAGRWSAPLAAAARAVKGWRGTRYDDLVWHDPLPLLAEAWCYAALFVRSGGDTNPEVEAMLA